MSEGLTSLDAILSELRKELAPVFDQQRQTWEREGPAVMLRAQELGIEISSVGGNCPVQGYGGFDGKRFYFRARGDSWQFHVADTDDDIFSNDWEIDGGYGEGFDAGWMPKHEAVNLICDGVKAYREATNA